MAELEHSKRSPQRGVVFHPTDEEDPAIGCLRCRHCVLLPHSDFSIVLRPDGTPDEEVSVPIFCKKEQRARPARLWKRCFLADPRLQFRKTKGGSRVYSGGDARCFATEAENEFLQAVYSRLEWGALLYATMRPKPTLLSMAVRRGLYRAEEALKVALVNGAVAAKLAHQKSGRAFNDAQSAYVIARHLAGHRNEPFEGLPPELVWPRSGWGHPSFVARNREVKAAIVARAAELGPAKSWEAIRRHPEWKSKKYQAEHLDRKRARRRKVCRSRAGEIS